MRRVIPDALTTLALVPANGASGAGVEYRPGDAPRAAATILNFTTALSQTSLVRNYPRPGGLEFQHLQKASDMKRAVFALAIAATLGVAALVTPSPAQAWRRGWGPGLTGGLIGAVIGGITSSVYGYGPGFGYYGGPRYGYYGRYARYYRGYVPAYSNYGYVPAYHSRYRSSYYAPAYYGHRYRRARSKPAEEWSEAALSPSGKARRPPRAMVGNPPPKIMVGQQRPAGRRLDRNDQTPDPTALAAPMNAEATRGTATAERPTDAEPRKAELSPAETAETPKSEAPKAELDSQTELQLAEATALAERLTATDASLSKTDSGDDTTASVSKNIESLTALVLTGLEVGEISDLAGKFVAINGALPGSSGLLRTAIVAAGAPGIQLKDGQPEPIEALRRGEVSAVILGLVTVEQARAFPKVENFKLFRVSLSPG
jgi:hypothetical protein